MESTNQAYWHSEYNEFKNHFVQSKANRNYASFAKRQFHKARRNNDKRIIENQIQPLIKEEALLNQIFNKNYNTFQYL